MEIAIVGLGRMGMNMLERLAADGHTVYGFDTDPAKMPDGSESCLDHGAAGQAGG